MSNKEIIIQAMEKFAPLHHAASFDNVGMLIDINDEIEKVMVVLDVTKDVVEEAKEKGVDLIISHHPIIFHAIKRISQYDAVFHAIKNGISIYCAHTNTDLALKGVNYEFAKLIGLCDIKPLCEDVQQEIFGMTGMFEKQITLEDLCLRVKKNMDVPSLRVLGDKDKMLKKAMVCGGSGADMIEAARCEGADVVITSEIKHDHYIENLEKNICLIDAGHYDTEKQFANLIKTHLQDVLNDINCSLAVLTAESDVRPYWTI